MRAHRADVRRADAPRLEKISSPVTAPLMDQSEDVVLVDAVVVRDCARRNVQERVGHRQRRYERADARAGEEERRLLRQLTRDRRVCAGVVAQAVPETDDGTVCGAPRGADTRREVVPVGFDETRGGFAVKSTDLSGLDGRDRGEI